MLSKKNDRKKEKVTEEKRRNLIRDNTVDKTVRVEQLQIKNLPSLLFHKDHSKGGWQPWWPGLGWNTHRVGPEGDRGAAM